MATWSPGSAFDDTEGQDDDHTRGAGSDGGNGSVMDGGAVGTNEGSVLPPVMADKHAPEEEDSVSSYTLHC